MNERFSTRFTRAYGVRHPIALAPLAFVGTTPELAVAVCRAGGLGAVAMGPLPVDAVRALIKSVKAETDAPFNVNFITFLANRAKIQVCIDEGVRVVSFHWGHPPREFIDALHEAEIKVWEQVGSVEDARRAADDGIDLIIAQGSEAGGHNFGTLPTFVLLPSIVEAVQGTPVLAAGGVTTGRQLAAALVLGADGVSVGTRFVASTEAYAHADYKKRLVHASGTHTRLSSVYGPNFPDFNPMRVLDTGLAREYAGLEDTVPVDMEAQPLIATMKLAGKLISLRRFSSFVPTPDTEGLIDQLPFLAGQGVGLIDDIEPVATIIERMMKEANAAMSGVQRV